MGAVEGGVPLDIAAVIADGRLYSTTELNAALSAHERFFADAAYATGLEVLARALFPGARRN